MHALLNLAGDVRPQLAVLSGDITQRARRRQFEAARTFTDQLDVGRVLVLPGNHDIPLFNVAARISSPYGNYSRAFGSELEAHYRSEEFLVIGVNTTRPYRHKDGEVSREQVQRVSECLRNASAEQIRIVVTHQPVHVIRQEDESNLLHGAQYACREWSAAGADLIMGGHIHLPYLRPLSDRYAGLSRRTWAVQAGTAMSYRVRYAAPNSVNIVRRVASRPPACTVERWDFAMASGQFELVQSDTLLVDR